jgi:hypothetical protein
MVHKITNVLDFFSWRSDLMILLRANPLLRRLEGVSHKTFLCPEMATSEAPLPMALEIGFARIKIITSCAW